jgi:hypothetical protein
MNLSNRPSGSFFYRIGIERETTERMHDHAGHAPRSAVTEGGLARAGLSDASVNHIPLNPCYKHQILMETLSAKVVRLGA